MGPQASAKLVSILVEMSTREFGAKNCDEFPEISLDSIPHPDFISNKRNCRGVLKMLKNRIKKMEKMNISIFALPCNTAHILFHQLQLTTRVPFVSVINETINELRRKRINKVGLLASPTTFKSGIFQKAFRPERSVWPERWVYYQTNKKRTKDLGRNY